MPTYQSSTQLSEWCYRRQKLRPFVCLLLGKGGEGGGGSVGVVEVGKWGSGGGEVGRWRCGGPWA